jgi:DNA-directed RNA polymerase subunit RPC12/RpoP
MIVATALLDGYIAAATRPCHREASLNAQSDTIEFNCAGCGKQVRARIDQGGKRTRCPDCGSTIQVPRVALGPRPAAVSARTTPAIQVPFHGHTIHASPNASSGWLRVPSTFSELLMYLIGTWGAMSLLLLIIGLFSTLLGYIVCRCSS